MNLPIQLIPSDWGDLRPKGMPKRETLAEAVRKYEETPPGQLIRPVSSVYGKIDQLLLFYPSNADGRYRYWEVLDELMTKMMDVQKFVLLVTGPKSEKRQKHLENLRIKFGSKRLCIVQGSRRNPSSVWARDPFWSIEYKSEKSQKFERYLVEPCEIGEDGATTAYLGKEQQLKLNGLVSNLNFEGGNLLVGDNLILAGIGNQQAKTAVIPELVRKWFGIDPVLIQSSGQVAPIQQTAFSGTIRNVYKAIRNTQPFFHIDLFITLAGKNKQGRSVVVVGDPVTGFPVSGLARKQRMAIQSFVAGVKKSVDEVANRLEKDNRGLVVVRNPLPLAYYDKLVGRKERCIKRQWCWASYNNCLVEVFKNSCTTKRRVWLPSYGHSSNYKDRELIKDDRKRIELIESEHRCSLPRTYGDWTYLKAFDLGNKVFWQKLEGTFEVNLLESDYTPFLLKNGSLNCITNCISRTNYTSNRRIAEKP